MGYSGDVREKLLYTDCKKPCCAAAELLGMNVASPDVFSCNDESVKSRIKYLKKKSAGKEANFESLGDCCKKAFVKGVFEIKGTLSSPESKAPYVEIYFEDEKEAEKYREILASMGVKAGISKRRNKYVVYVKNAEGISNFLLLIDASSEALKFMVSKTDREVINNTNRIMNCDMANLERQNARYNEEFKHISYLISNNLLIKLSERHVQIAMARIDNPDATYEEIGKIIVPNCSKSTISLKMREILKFFG